MNCEQVWREISNYVDGEVDAALRSAMDEHFHTCKRCASVLAGTRNVVELYGDERMLEVPAGFSQRLEKRLGRLEKNTASSGSRWSSLSAWLVPLAAIALFTGALALVDQLSFEAASEVETGGAGEGHSSGHAGGGFGWIESVSRGGMSFHSRQGYGANDYGQTGDA